jgi:PAS domain S-box-containing protein
MIPSLNTELERLQTAVRADVAVILDRVIGTTESFAALTLPQGLLESELAWPLVNEMPPALTLVSDPRQIAYLVPTEARVQMPDVVRAALWVELTPALVLVLIWSRNAPPETLAHTLDERLRGDLLLLAADWVERRRDRLTIQRLSGTVQAVTEALVTVDDLHGVAYLNPAAAALFGLPGQQKVNTRQFAEAMERLHSRLLNPKHAQTIAVALQSDPSATVQHVLWQFATAPLFLSVSTSPLPHGRLWVFSDVSEREAAVQAEAQASRRYRFIAENSKDMILCIAPNGQRTYVSPFAYELTGYTPEELMAEPRVIIAHPDEYRAGGEAFQKAMLSGANYFQIEQRVRHKDGHYIWTDLSTTLVRDPQTGALVEVIGIAHDITERKQLEDALKASEELYRLLAENIQDVIFKLDINGTRKYVSSAIRHLGYTPQELIGLSGLDMVHPDDRDALRTTLRETVAAGKNQMIIQYRHRHKEGHYLWTETAVNVIRDAVTGKPLELVNIARDITERKRLEDALRESEMRLSHAQRIAHVGDWEFDVQAGALTWSDETYRLYGYRPQEMPVSFALFLSTTHPQDRARLDEAITAALYDGTDFTLDYRIRLPNGSERFVHNQTEVIRDEDGKSQRMIGTVHDITERKRLEAELAVRYDELDQFFNVTEDLLCITDSNGILLKVNRAWEKLLGLPVKQIENRPFMEFVHLDDVQATLGAMEQLGQDKPVIQFVNRYRSADGSYRDIEWCTNPHGGLIYASARDITERKRLEAELAARYEELDQFFNVTDEMLTIANLEGKLLKVNRAWENLLGLPVKQIENRLFMEFVHPDDVQATLGAMEQLGQDKPVVQFINRYRSADGSYRFIEWRTNPHGNLIYASARDITERRQIEEALRESEEKYRLIAENTSDGILVLDSLIGAITYASPAFDLQHGRAIGETQRIKPDALHETIHSEDRERVLQQIFAAVDRKASDLVYSYRSQHKDGHYLWCEDHSRFNYAPDGKYLSSIIISRNVTERKEAEQRQMELQLEQERAELLSRFICDAAHEFRTPLAIIGSATYLLLRSDKPEVRRRKADSIETQIKRITRLLDSLLLMARVDSHDKLESKPVGLGLVLLSECQQLQDTYGNHPVMLQLPFPHLSGVIGDASLLADAFRQILDNAMRFTPKDGTVTVEAGMAGDRLWVEIMDTGMGIAPENLLRVFDTFWRHDDAHSIAGFGLGLSIAKRIIERHGGTITLNSTVNAGTRVRVTLPTGG